MPSPRSLPIYGGRDAGPRPATRDTVKEALDAGTDPVLVVERIARHLDAIAKEHATLDIAGESKPACAKGCSYCCHQRVEVTAPEVFLLARVLRNAEDARRATRLAEVARSVAGMDGRAYHLAQARCALLGDDGACTVYEARPLACRRAHSTDVSVCEAVHLDPAREARVVPACPTLSWNLSSLVLGYLEGAAHAGQPPHQYELHAALAMAMADPASEERFLRGEDPLAAARTRRAEDLPALLGRAC